MRPARQGLYEPRYEHDACGIGFIVDMDGRKSHSIIRDGLTILQNLKHRGAVGGDQKTGDGAGMLLQIPDRFFRKVLSFKLPEKGAYGLGFLFMPADAHDLEAAKKMVEDVLQREKAPLLGWRKVPVFADNLGAMALESMPAFYQIFVNVEDMEPQARERKLFILRKSMENAAREKGWKSDDFYVSSLSSCTVIYKGMFVAEQLAEFYEDFSDEDFESALAMVHQRYSTNTFPSWSLAQPFRFLAHNGEINTLRGNINKMTALNYTLESPLFGKEIKKIFPIIDKSASDSAIFDNVFELLTMSGRSMEHVMMMMAPEAFGYSYHISQDKRAFYEYHMALMDPWDGPAAFTFCDGSRIGAYLDRNGLRPSRYIVTQSRKVILASETGVLDIDPADVREKGKLGPGKMFMVDTQEGRIIRDNEIKARVTRWKPYRRWLEENKIELTGLFQAPGKVQPDKEILKQRQQIFGYSQEDIKNIILPMVLNKQEPVGSMGNDAALAVLSERPRLLYDYFRQTFAQVTNPPIDPYRENLVMSLSSFVGRERNLLEETPLHCRQLKLTNPILTNDDIERLIHSEIKDFKVCRIDMCFEARENALENGLSKLCINAEKKVDEGFAMVILSDRSVSEERAPIPALLAVSAVHHHLVRRFKRHLAALILETGEAREVHHFAALISYGASGVNPYLVFDSITDLIDRGYISRTIPQSVTILNYITAVNKGLLKVMSKMGISTLRGYRHAQTFEILGLDRNFVQRYFAGTRSSIGGIGLREIEHETLLRHKRIFNGRRSAETALPSDGQYAYRREGEKHLFSPAAIVYLQQAVRNNDYALFKKYSAEITDTQKNLCTLRGLFKIKSGHPVPLQEVESEEEIIKRFVSSAMSFGSISKEAHETLALAMNRLGAQSNSGEGGEEAERYKPLPNGDSLNSKVKQVASARFGVSSVYLVQAEELQIKMAQGAKPGEGGQLPGFKVNEIIAKVRHSTPGVMLISPPPHHDIYSIEDLSQLIYDLKRANPKARVSVKLVAEVGVGTVAAGVAKAQADTVLISGSDGGTGAAPLSSIKHTGSAWEIGLAETQQTLLLNGLRDQIRIQVDGQLKTGRDVVIAALLGAEEFGFGTAALVSLGCIMMRKCHLNTCPVGVATQDPRLRQRFNGKAEHVINFMRFIAREVREYMAQLGFRTFNEMVGRSDLLNVITSLEHYKAKNLDFSAIFYFPENIRDKPRYCTKTAADKLTPASDDNAWVGKCRQAIKNGKKIKLDEKIRNHYRAAGAELSYEVSRRYGFKGLAEDTIHIHFSGSAGQSFGAFLAKGITLELEGDANDYLGKGLSGGKIIVYPPKESSFLPQKNIISGNVNLFGATSGEAYINGRAGERFAVRNSGAVAVVEGVGDHGCEYMTGGRVIVLGKTGVNFAAGMSGGIAYVLDENQLFDTHCNLEMVDIEPVREEKDIQFLQKFIKRHYKYTSSPLAHDILKNWTDMLPYFVRVMPIDYRRALQRIEERKYKEAGVVGMTEEVYD